MELIFAKAGGILFIGMCKNKMSLILENPRIVYANQEEGSLSLSRCIGSPKTIELRGNIDFHYVNCDPELQAFYDAETAPEEAKEPGKIIQLVK